MEQISDFKELVERLRSQSERPVVVIVCPEDVNTQAVVERALTEDIADFTLVGVAAANEWAQAVRTRFSGHVKAVDASTPDNAAALAVDIVRQGGGDVLMKGRINTDNLLHAVLNKQRGLLEPGKVLSHLTVASIPSYYKLLVFSDAAVIPSPTAEQMKAIVSYCVENCRRLGVDKPNVALINCTEKINDAFPVTRIYEQLLQEARNGVFGAVNIDGPMDVKTACDLESGLLKGMTSPVIGKADALVFPNIQAGNVFYKTVTVFGGASTAGMLCGTMKPVVVSSRADTDVSKYYSLVLACLVSVMKK